MTDTGKKYKVWEPLLLSLMVTLGMVAGAKLVESGPPGKKQEIGFTNAHYSGRQVEEIIRFLETKYVGQVSADDLVAKAIATIMEDLDPHTHYFPPDQLEELEERTMGHYVGIGIEVAFLGDSLVVLYPRKNSPAERVGLKPGDYILAVDDREIAADSLARKEILENIKGARGSNVKLTIKPMLSDSIRKVEVTREEIKVPSVVAGYMLDSNIAYIKIQRFTNTTYREFMDQWERMSTQHQAKHLVLDLRDNPGGYMSEAVNILSQFMEEEGKLLVYTEGRNQERQEYKSTGKVFFPVGHIAVLINEASASASEIVAGCVQDLDRGVILGTRSYGKGLVQEQYKLSNGGILRMTVSKYYTPSGRLIQKAYDDASVIDTVAVFRTSMGRPVHAGGGIIPDISISDDIDWNHPVMMQLMDVISEYAIRYNLTTHGGEIVSVDRIDEVKQQLPADSTIIKEISSLSALRVMSYDSSTGPYVLDHQEDILRIAKATLVAYRTGEEGWYVAFNSGDPAVLKATEMVKLDPEIALKAD